MRRGMGEVSDVWRWGCGWSFVKCGRYSLVNLGENNTVRDEGRNVE